MSPEKKLKFLKMLGVKVPNSQVRAGWIVSGCPLGPWRHGGGEDKNPSFAIRKKGSAMDCHCFSCDWHGDLTDLVYEMRLQNKAVKHYDVKWGELLELCDTDELDELDCDAPDIEEMLFGKGKKEMTVFPDWWLDSFASVSDSKEAMAYVAERDVPEEIVNALDLRWDGKEKRVCFPVRDFSEKLVGLHGRATEQERQPRYRMYTYQKQNNPLVWLGEHWVDLTKPIVVVEGPFDLTSVMRVYRNVVSPLFATPSADKIKRMRDALEVVTFFDHGTGGDAGRKRFTKWLGDDHVLTHAMPPKGKKDPGAMSIPELQEVLGPLVQLDYVIS